MYTTGIAYRRDEIDDAVFAGDDAWKVLWDPTYQGYVGVLDDAREALTLAMYYRGVYGHQHRRPRRSSTPPRPTCATLVAATNARFDILAYQKIPDGTSHVNQAW